METPRLNWYAIALCAVINFVFSNLWFGPLFGDRWYGMHGIVMDKANMTFTKNGVTPDFNPVTVILTAVLGAIVTGYFMAFLFRRMGVSGWKDGAHMGVIIGLFTFIAVYINNLFACNPPALALIEGGGTVVLFGLYGVLLGGWQRK